MSYVNNGIERSLTVKVYKKVGGNYAQGYPKTYNGQQAFPGYPSLTDEQVRRLSDIDFSDRLSDFESYVEGVEGGCNFDTDVVGDGATRSSGSCLTTTTTQPQSYSFSVRYGSEGSLACTGPVTTVYCLRQNPQLGDILYKDAALSQPWELTTGGNLLFIYPTVFGSKTISVFVGRRYTGGPATGEIISIDGYNCSGQQVTTTVVQQSVTPVFLAVPINGYALSDLEGLTINEAISSGITDSGHVFQKYIPVSVPKLQEHNPYGYVVYNNYACTQKFDAGEQWYAILDTGIPTSVFQYQVYINNIGGTHLWMSL